MALHRLHHVARHQVIERHHAAARVPRREQLVLAIVERKRQHRQRAIVRRQAEVIDDAIRTQPHVGVAQHHPLGPPGGAAGVEDRGQFLWIGLRGWQLRAKRVRRFQRRCLADQAASGRHVPRAQRLQPRRGAYQHACAAIREDVCHLRVLEQRVDGHMHQPGARGRQRQQTRQLALGRPARHPRAFFRHFARQPASQASDTRS